MLNRFLILYFLWICIVTGITGCSVFKSGTKSFAKTKDSPPLITNVQSCRIVENRYIASSSLSIGEKGTFRVTVIDKNLDIKKLYIRGYFPRRSEDPNIEFGPFDLAPQEKKRTSFYLKEPVEFKGPPGDWLLEVQIEDENNNLSNIYRLHVIVHL